MINNISLKPVIKILIPALALAFAHSTLAGGAVVVHPSNSANFDKKVVQRIFLGKLGSFSTGEKAVALDLPADTGTHKLFSEKVLNKKQSQLKSYWAKLVFTGKGTPPKKLDSGTDVIDLIKDNPNIIGYVDEADVTDDVKVVLSF